MNSICHRLWSSWLKLGGGGSHIGLKGHLRAHFVVAAVLARDWHRASTGSDSRSITRAGMRLILPNFVRLKPPRREEQDVIDASIERALPSCLS